ncbi:MAG: cytidine deaminase [Neisseriaceae bacterium]|jgi:cytidine deaminase
MEIQNITIPVRVYSSINELSKADQELIILAGEALEYSYSPYSSFKVGAAAILEDGSTIYGSNQENSSYGVTLCAERVLVAGHIASGNKNKIKTIAITYKSLSTGYEMPITPCGICRQTLSEVEKLQKQPIRLILYGKNFIWEIEKTSDILPLAFGNEILST